MDASGCQDKLGDNTRPFGRAFGAMAAPQNMRAMEHYTCMQKDGMSMSSARFSMLHASNAK
eukprot:37719-Karenia_brevis.AAC.1